MATPPRFAPLAAALRDGVIEYYESTGARLDTPAGRRTLDTNSSLAADRGRLLLRLLAASGGGTVAGRRVLDLGAGFGALSVYMAHLGAEVVALDFQADRMQVGVGVARRHGLGVNAVTGYASQLPLPDAAFHVAMVNNSLCYVVDRSARRAALAELRRVLMPGGYIVIRNPNRLTPVDPFTGLPLLALFGPSLSSRLARHSGRERSWVRLTSPPGATHQLRRAGFVSVQRPRPPRRRHLAWFDRYHHVVGRTPAGG